ncbi:hypothetical protein CsatB_008637 [Cannabis sativa]
MLIGNPNFQYREYEINDQFQCLVFHLKQFTSDVKIKSISVVGGADGTSPSKMRAFLNREGIDFSDAQSMQAVQEWELAENSQGVLEYQTRYSKFQSVGNITLHFPENFGGDASQIHYIGFKGEATQLKRDVVATIVYEITPNPSDHKEEEGKPSTSPSHRVSSIFKSIYLFPCQYIILKFTDVVPCLLSIYVGICISYVFIV